MATHTSTLPWKIPQTESLVDYSPWGCKESDTTKDFTFTFIHVCIHKENLGAYIQNVNNGSLPSNYGLFSFSPLHFLCFQLGEKPRGY